jgi:hypothetical protein
MLADWLATPQGCYALDWEREQFASAVDDVFDFNARSACRIDKVRPFRFSLTWRVRR